MKLVVLLLLVLTLTTSLGNAQPTLKISELNSRQFEFGTYFIEGFVTKGDSCPKDINYNKCRKFHQNSIVVSEEDKPSEGLVLTERDLIIFTENKKSFRPGSKYKMLINILNVNSTGQNSNNVRLIYAKRIM